MNFSERLKAGATCITDEDVHAIIRSMGRPEDFEPAEPDAGSYEKNNQGAAEAELLFSRNLQPPVNPKIIPR